MEEWKEYKLGDIYEVHNGLSKGGKFFGSGYPFLSFSTIFNNWFVPNELSNLVQSTEKEQESYSIKEGDVFITRTSETSDELGMSCVALKDYPKATYNGFCKRMRQYNHDIEVLPKYIGYYLRNPHFRLHFQAFSGSMSTRASLTNEALLGLTVKLPPLPTQQKIAAILSSLDDKIELNNKINTNLEQQAQALFKNWFVDGSEKSHTIGDYIVPKRGKNLLSKDAILGEVPVVAGGLEPATYHNTANTKAPVLTISASGANAGFVNLWNIPVWSSDSSYIDSEMTNDVYFWYILLKLRQKEIFDSQTGSAQPHIYPQHISVMPISELDFNKVSLFTKHVTPFFEQIGANKQENLRLVALRDTLLPKLMNGEIEV